jgi:broad specificity phosphatase PhoE
MRLFIFCFIAIVSAACSSTTHIYIVRHAEKSAPSGDVALSGDGLARAATLRDSLKSKHIDAVFTTPYKRTTQTAMPTATQFGLDTTTYNNGDSLLAKLAAKKKRNYLVVGHSNTVPQMIRSVGLTTSFSGNIPDEVYDFLFVVKVKNGKKSLKEGKYGVPSM